MGTLHYHPLANAPLENVLVDDHDSTGGGGSGGGDNMQQRVKLLEEKVSSITTDIAVIKSNYATKEDTATIKVEIAQAKAELHSALRTQAMTIIGSMIAIVGIASGIIIKILSAHV
ncbi:hypothetical protein V2E64_002919 [Klebsiella aerogenes]|nr:hypothetical protein [Klebsiella aerogenes]